VSNNPNKVKGAILARLLKGDKRGKSRFQTDFNEVARYGWAKDFGFEYQTLPKDAFFRAKVALTAQAIKVFGPYLYSNNPNRTVTAKAWATTEMQRRAEVIGDYLNYTPNEYGLYYQSRRAIDEAICGAGVVWTGLHPTKPHVVCSMYDTVRNLVLDADAADASQMRRVWRHRVRPRSDVMAEYPEAAAEIKKLQKATKRLASAETIPGEDTSIVGDLVEYYEGYFSTGLSTYEENGELSKLDAKLGADGQVVEVAPDVPLKYLITEDGRLLHECEWEIPLWRDGQWPCSVLGFHEYPDSAYPVSPLSDAIGFQKAINWIVTLMMGKYRFTSRTVMAVVDQNGQGLSETDKNKVLIGSDIEAISVKVNGESRSLKDFIQQFEWSHDYLSHGMTFLSLMETHFQKASGLYEILYSGQTDTQSRTATDAQVKDRNSMSRVNDMRERVAKWQSEIARKEALAARFLLTRKEIGLALGPDAAEAWGFLVKPEMADVNQWVQMFAGQGMPIDQAIMLAQQKMADAVSLDQWAAEIDYGIEADSLRRRDVDQRIDALKEMMNQTVPSLIQSPDPIDRAFAYDTMAEYHDAIGAPRSLVQMERDRANMLRAMPPMLPPAPPGAEPPPGPML
jgi:uncharacterized small protein (DUF1192 family)